MNLAIFVLIQFSYGGWVTCIVGCRGVYSLGVLYTSLVKVGPTKINIIPLFAHAGKQSFRMDQCGSLITKLITVLLD